MRKVSVLAMALLLVSGAAMAATVVGTEHDLSSTGPGAKTNTTQVCVFCHTPHQADAAAGQDPLWNHTLSTQATYGVYSSSTLNATVTELGGAAAGSQAVSNLCLSCHDGTVAVHSVYATPHDAATVTITAGGNVNASGIISGGPLVGTDLTNDHPVNFIYNLALADEDGGLVTPSSASTVDGTVPLFGGTVQCASCHNPHDNTTAAPFLVATNAGSALCVRCHNK